MSYFNADHKVLEISGYHMSARESSAQFPKLPYRSCAAFADGRVAARLQASSLQKSWSSDSKQVALGRLWFHPPILLQCIQSAALLGRAAWEAGVQPCYDGDWATSARRSARRFSSHSR